MIEHDVIRQAKPRAGDKSSGAQLDVQKAMSEDQQAHRPVVGVFAEPLLPFSMTFIRAQASALRGFKPFYLSPQRSSPSLDISPIPSVVICDSPNGHKGWNLCKQIPFKVFGYDPFFFRQVRKHGPALIHAHSGPAGLTVQPLARWLKVPMIVTFHGADATLTDEYLLRSYYRVREYSRKRKWFQQQNHPIIAVSDFIRKALIAQGFCEDRIVVHYIGVDTNFFSPLPEVKREPVVLFVARLVEKKGCEYLIQAMREVQEAEPKAELVVIGDGELRKQLEHLAGQTLRNYHFLGACSPEVVRSWMNRASVFSVPSLRAHDGDAEGFGMVFAEAQAMGLPVVSCWSGGIPEAVKHGVTGLLAPEKNWRSLASHIVSLLRDSNLWLRMSQAGRQRVQSSFDLTAQTVKLEEIYEKALAESLSA